MKIVTSDQMRQIEARSAEAGVSTDALMERAGLEVARRIRDRTGRLVGVPVVVLVGSGNNGGDGLVAARHLQGWGARALVYLCGEREQPDPKLDIARERGVRVLNARHDTSYRQLGKALGSAHLVLDSVLGTGRARPIEGMLREIFLELGAVRARRPGMRIVAVDLPTGLDADTGDVDPVCAAADITATLGYPKVGLFTFPGAEKVGVLEVVDIGIPAGLDGDVGLELVTSKRANAALPERPSAAHKGTFGRTLVVAGSRSYIGAAYLAATAAARVGAGLVTVAAPESLIASVAAKGSEPTYLPLPESSPGVVSSEAASLIFENIGNYQALLVGCGIGQSSSTRELVERLLFPGTQLPPTVVDADGLNILSRTRSWWKRYSARAIVTPHPGEMARLAGRSLDESANRHRISEARQSAVKWGKVTVLKGAHTVVAFPNGEAMLSPFANPGLASAGTGDVLAGAIAGLLSQGLSLENAAALGVYLHGAAGERVREEIGETGMIASDLLAALPRAINDIRARP